jgi:hypothetical protein
MRRLAETTALAYLIDAVDLICLQCRSPRRPARALLYAAPSFFSRTAIGTR